MDSTRLWKKCLNHLEKSIAPAQFNMWLRPLQPRAEERRFLLLAPNRFVADWVRDNHLENIKKLVQEFGENHFDEVKLEIAGQRQESSQQPGEKLHTRLVYQHNLNPGFTFDGFVQGKSNELAVSAAMQVSRNLGRLYNPLVIYGGVGLGKTHLMQAVGNHILHELPKTKVHYLHSERFVDDMIKAMQHNTFTDFKKFYRSLNVLLVDDIQFLSGKTRSQEEFFHTFDTMIEQKQQVILTCDRSPGKLEGLQERLKSRFTTGLSVSIDPPELDTRVNIVVSKADQLGIHISKESATFISRKVKTSIRELEGALRRVHAYMRFTGKRTTFELVKEALKDLMTLQNKSLTIEFIKKSVAQYYGVSVEDINSRSRARLATRARQVAICLAKELTQHSLPKIGQSFGGRDHTTVLHSYQKVKELRKQDSEFNEEVTKLTKILEGNTES